MLGSIGLPLPAEYPAPVAPPVCACSAVCPVCCGESGATTLPSSAFTDIVITFDIPEFTANVDIACLSKFSLIVIGRNDFCLLEVSIISFILLSVSEIILDTS